MRILNASKRLNCFNDTLFKLIKISSLTETSTFFIDTIKTANDPFFYYKEELLILNNS